MDATGTNLSRRPGNYLSIDGGINPLSSLYIIDEILQRIEYDTQADQELRACDWFDLIVGSGHGGIIAILLGRLEMTTCRAIETDCSLLAAMTSQTTESKEERHKNTENLNEHSARY
ncbi:hypothetical protein CPB86DRAFT_788673 [Serendipita vermifera]|nr:hypothetical protein CPB86DRAFT_788673 [Serendipita vermifera]